MAVSSLSDKTVSMQEEGNAEQKNMLIDAACN